MDSLPVWWRGWNCWRCPPGLSAGRGFGERVVQAGAMQQGIDLKEKRAQRELRGSSEGPAGQWVLGQGSARAYLSLSPCASTPSSISCKGSWSSGLGPTQEARPSSSGPWLDYTCREDLIANTVPGLRVRTGTRLCRPAFPPSLRPAPSSASLGALGPLS